jgi:ElaB/YqjD/DUF883 family membrane-anchored ribosome-binding protein
MERGPAAPMPPEGGDEFSSERPDASGTERAKAVAGSAGEQARAVAGTATDQTKEVVQQAGEQARQVAQEARSQLRSLTEQGRDQLRSQAEAQTQRASGNLRTLSEQARALAEGRTEQAGPLTGYVQDLSARLSEWADRLDGRGFGGLISEIQGFARRRPAAFIGLSAAAGFAVSRVGKAAQADSSDGDAGAGSMAPPRAAAVPEPPVAPVVEPPITPVVEPPVAPSMPSIDTPGTVGPAEPWPATRETEPVTFAEGEPTSETEPRSP